MSGNIGRLFREFGITIAAATLFSLLVSFTLTPMLASRWLQARPTSERGPLARFGAFWDRGYERLAAGYRWLLGVALQGALAGRRGRVQRAVLVGSYMMLQLQHDRLGVRPARGRRQLPGQHHDAARDVARRRPTRSSGGSRQASRGIPEVENVFTSVGGGGGFGGGGGTRNAQHRGPAQGQASPRALGLPGAGRRARALARQRPGGAGSAPRPEPAGRRRWRRPERRLRARTSTSSARSPTQVEAGRPRHAWRRRRPEQRRSSETPRSGRSSTASAWPTSA